ncbi:unnamed protein product [Malus baccata var. baccata]
MEFIGFFQVLIVVTSIITLLYTYFRSLTFSCWPFSTSFSSSSGNDDDDIPAPREKYDDDDIPAPRGKGEDTRNTFTSHLHGALLRKKIETYIDYRLVRGGEKYGQLVIPIFYGTGPSTVRKQKGSYEVAFAQHEKRFKGAIGKVNMWRAALTTAANLSGFSNETGTEADLVTEVVNEIWSQLNRKSSSVLKGLVGMERCIHEIESSLCIDSLDVYTVGIWGMGGIGKTTLADAVFHRLSSKFEASCFLENVREKSAKDGLVHLRNTLLSEILKENDLNIGTPTIGSDLVRKRMGSTKVLIVLDDVSDSKQLNFLAGDPALFGPGSRVIITTRDKSLLQKSVEHKIYEVQELNSDEAFQLFHLSAFGNNISRVDCAELSKLVVDYGGGIPLALQILGSSFLQCEIKEDWLDEWKEFPREKIWKVLRSSYDGLKEIEKEIFLDIACFYQGKDVYIVKEMLDICGFRASGSATLQAIFFNRSAIKGILLDHADFENMYDLRLLYVYNSSRNKYCNVKVSLPHSLTYLDWEGYPFKSLPSKLCPENLVELQMRNSQVEQLWNEGQNLMKLRVMDLGLSRTLMKVPDLSRSPNIEHINLSGTAIESLPESIGNLKSLEKLDLSETAIKCLPESIGNLKSLEKLDLSGTAIKCLTESIGNLKSLEKLDLRGTAIKNLPASIGNLKSLEKLDLSGTAIKCLPESIGNLKSLEKLDLRGTAIKNLPASIGYLKSLEKLDLSGTAIESLPESIGNLKSLEKLDLSGTAIKCLPESIGNLKSLEKLDLSGTVIKCLPASIKEASRLISLQLTNCRSLQSLPELPGVRWLQAYGCTSLKQVLSSKTALTLGWDEYKNSQGLQEQLTFSNCKGMGWDAWRDIVTDSQIRIMRMATALSKYFTQEEIKVAFHLEFEEESNEYVFKSPVCIVCPGSTIPRWFPYEVDKSVLRIELGSNFFNANFLGFTYSVVVAFKNYNVGGSLRLGCKINFKGYLDNRMYHRTCMIAEYGEINECKLNTPHVFIWFSTFDHVKQGSYNGVIHATFDFYPIIHDRPDGVAVDLSKIKVTKCGVFPMYAPVDSILASRMKQVRELNIEARMKQVRELIIEAHESFPYLDLTRKMPARCCGT